LKRGINNKNEGAKTRKIEFQVVYWAFLTEWEEYSETILK